MTDFTASFTTDRSRDEVFAAIRDVRGWWSESVRGASAERGDSFRFEVPGVHTCTMTLTEVAPGERMVWHVTDSWVVFAADTAEWEDTDVVFTLADRDGRTVVTFTHVGLSPAVECYDLCTDAWTGFVTGSLKQLIETGRGEPMRREDEIAAAARF
jgi:predicted lipoprotein with Yx(FWY)xxD motif